MCYFARDPFVCVYVSILSHLSFTGSFNRSRLSLWTRVYFSTV